MEERYLYESHLGGCYSSENEYDYEDLYCEDCGDSDWLLGTFTDEKSLRKLLKEQNYEKEYINTVVEQEFPKAKKIETFKKPILMKNGHYVEERIFDNKYNLKPKTIQEDYVVADFESLLKHNNNGKRYKNKYGSFEANEPFWYNGAIKAVVRSGASGCDGFCDSEYWIGLYEDGHIEVNFSADDGMCNYIFDEFGKVEEMDNEFDYDCQYNALCAMNNLIDSKIIIKKTER